MNKQKLQEACQAAARKHGSVAVKAVLRKFSPTGKAADVPEDVTDACIAALRDMDKGGSKARASDVPHDIVYIPEPPADEPEPEAWLVQEHVGAESGALSAEVMPAHYPQVENATALDSDSHGDIPDFDQAYPEEQRTVSDRSHAVTNADFMSGIFGVLPEKRSIAITHFPDVAEPNWNAQFGRPELTKDHPDENAYYAPSSLNGNGRDLQHFAALHVLVLDDITADVLTKLPPPTYALETSAGNYQVGYKLAAPLADLVTARALHNALQVANYCDNNGNNPVRWVRAPVGRNTKPGKMFSHVLHIWETERTFTVEQLVERLKLKLNVAEIVADSSDVGDLFARMPEPKLQQPGVLAKLLQCVHPDIGRDDWRVLIAVIFTHLGDTGREVARAWCSTGQKYMISDDQKKRQLSAEAADHQFDRIWNSIAADESFRRGGVDFFGLMKRLGAMTSADIAQWHKDTITGEPVPDHVDTPATNTIPFNIDYPPGLVGDIARYVHGASLTPIKSFSIAAGLFALSLLSANRHYGGRMDTGLNLFIICCAPTGVGKDASRKALKKLFAGTQFLKHIWEKAASATGILRALSRADRPLFALMSDEIGLTLQSYSGARVNQNDKMVMGLILNLFGSARQPMSGSAYAKAEDNIEPITNPFFSLFGSSTPETLYPAFNMELVTAGTVNRIVVVGAAGIDPEPERLNFEIPEQLQDVIREFERNAGFAPEGIGAIEDAVAARQADDVAVEFAPGVFEHLQGLIDNLDAEGQPEALWGRYREQIIRVAALLAVGEGGTITKYHVTWAHNWIDWCVRNFNRRLVPLLTNTDFSKKAQQVLEIIQNAKKYLGDKRWGPYCKRGFMPMAKLKKTIPMPGREFDQIILHLVETYQIYSGKEGDVSVFWVPE